MMCRKRISRSIAMFGLFWYAYLIFVMAEHHVHPLWMVLSLMPVLIGKQMLPRLCAYVEAAIGKGANL